MELRCLSQISPRRIDGSVLYFNTLLLSAGTNVWPLNHIPIYVMWGVYSWKTTQSRLVMLTHSKESAAPPQHPPKLFLNYPYFSPFSSSLSLLFSPSSSHPSSLFCPSLILPPLYYNVIMFCSCRRINMIICNGCKSYLALQSTVHQDDYVHVIKAMSILLCLQSLWSTIENHVL